MRSVDFCVLGLIVSGLVHQTFSAETFKLIRVIINEGSPIIVLVTLDARVRATKLRFFVLFTIFVKGPISVILGSHHLIL